MKKVRRYWLIILGLMLVASVAYSDRFNGTVGNPPSNANEYTPHVPADSHVKDSVVRLGVWWPRYDGDLPPYSYLATQGIEASDVVNLYADTLISYDVVYIGRGAFYVHTGQGDMDVEAVKEWVANGGAIIGESESVIYDSVVTLGTDWSPELSYVCGVWSTQPDGGDYVWGGMTVTFTSDHPITAGLPDSFSVNVYSGEQYAYLDAGRNPTAEEVGVISSHNNAPIIAANYGSGRSVYFPYCPDGETDWESVGGQYLAQLFVNAVKWAAGSVGPTVVSISPPKGAKDVPIDTQVVITFSNPMNQFATKLATWLLKAPSKKEFDGTGTILTLIPEENLEYDKLYIVLVGKKAKDIEGNPLVGAPFISYFKTVASKAAPALRLKSKLATTWAAIKSTR